MSREARVFVVCDSEERLGMVGSPWILHNSDQRGFSVVVIFVSSKGFVAVESCLAMVLR